MTSKTKREQPDKQSQSIRYIKADNYISAYANNVAYIVSAIDFSLIFGQILEGNKEHLIIEQNAKITMTPVQAKLLLMVLAQQVDNFEKMNGQIVFPPGIQLASQPISLEANLDAGK
jgi:hypothetical protein